MALHTHGRSRRRLRVRMPDEEDDPPQLSIGEEMAGIPAQHRDSGTPGRRRSAGGDGQPAGGTTRTQSDPGPRLELERVEPAGEQPQMDRDALNRNKWLTIAAAGLSGLGALSDSPGLAKAGEGLATGFGQANRRRRKAFYNELADYRDRQQSAREENRARQRLEAEAEFEVEQGEREAERQRQLMDEKLENQLTEIDRRYDRKLELIREEQNREPTEWEKMQAEAERLRARADLIDAQKDMQEAQSGGGDDDGPVLPQSVEGVETQLQYWHDLRDKGIQETNTFGEPYRRRPNDDELETIQRNINLLERQRERLQGNASQDRDATESAEPTAESDPSSTGGAGGQGGATPRDAVERSRTARQAAGETSGNASQPSGTEDTSGEGLTQNPQTARMRQNLTNALRNVQSGDVQPSEVMEMARNARRNGAITQSEFRKIRANYGSR